MELPIAAVGQQGKADSRRGGRSPGGLHQPLSSVATPSRGGRGGRGGAHENGERTRGPASGLEEVMRTKGVDEAWNMLEEMQRQGSTTDKYTVSRMLMKTVGDGRMRLNPSRVYRGMALVEKFVEMQPKDVDEVLFNALLDTCCRLKDLGRLELIMQRMRDLQVTPSPVTLGILVKTYGQAGDIQKVLQVWSEMEKQRVQANAVTYGCMIDACVKCGRLDNAEEIFQGMREAGKHRNTILYTTLIKGYGLEKNLKAALELFREMPQEGVPYNTITYNSIIDACVKGGDLASAEQLLREITSPTSSLEPDLITFSTLLKGYCHIGDLDKALQVAEAIKARGLRCDELVYNTLMDGCVKANDVSAGVGLFEEMVQNGMRPSTITHSILARLYQRAGYEDDASEAVAQLYQHHGIERPSGSDRSKGSRRNYNTRSPGGRHAHDLGASPHGSPMAAMGRMGNMAGQRDRNDGCWNGWNESQSFCGYDNYMDPSTPSTPLNSPGHHTGCASNGLFLPLDGMQGVPPPLPSMSGSDTPYSSSLTPMNGSSFHGSVANSPCMPQPVPQQVPQPGMEQRSNVPPWPFANNAMPGAPMDGQQSPFPMPISPPHDLAYNSVPTAPGQPQVFFENWPQDGQQQVVGMQMNEGVVHNPFCL